MSECCSCPKCNPANPQGAHRPLLWKAEKITPGTFSGTYRESIHLRSSREVEAYKAKGYTVTPLGDHSDGQAVSTCPIDPR